MRIAIAVVAVVALAFATEAQAAPAKAPAKQPAAAAAPPPPPPGFFPCRSEAEICYVAIVTGKNEVLVQFTNAQQSDGIDQKPVNVFSDDAGSAALDLSQNLGRVVMLTGAYDPAKGINKAAVVDVASPILSFTIKSQMSGGEDQAAAGGGKGAPKRR
ncbi:hypothetical protein SAMN05519103_03369 [Rhizobiales bacterium GAS113]|jgi:hypothetical protein|nr:hypothetical protein SAMN05519103_03369 [Rhizobiales bacterium GAS113]